MQFKIGDRVIMVRHADWKADAVGTISGSPRQRRNSFGETYEEYTVEFDEPQSDFTDELHGNSSRTYKSSTVAAAYIQPLHNVVTSAATKAAERSWEDIDRFYVELIASGWRLQPLRAFASSIASSHWGRRVHPSTSHAALGLSVASTYSGRLLKPMIYVEHDAENNRFLIHYQECQGKEVDAESEPITVSSDTLLKMMHWLGVVDTHEQTNKAVNPSGGSGGF